MIQLLSFFFPASALGEAYESSFGKNIYMKKQSSLPSPWSVCETLLKMIWPGAQMAETKERQEVCVCVWGGSTL